MAVGGDSLLADFVASFLGAFMYFATLTEVSIVQGLVGAGMGQGPTLALLLAGPALSLSNILVIRNVLGTQKTAVFVTLVIPFATFTKSTEAIVSYGKDEHHEKVTNFGHRVPEMPEIDGAPRKGGAGVGYRLSTGKGRRDRPNSKLWCDDDAGASGQWCCESCGKSAVGGAVEGYNRLTGSRGKVRFNLAPSLAWPAGFEMFRQGRLLRSSALILPLDSTSRRS